MKAKNKTTLVTGRSRGIGKNIALGSAKKHFLPNDKYITNNNC